MEGSKGTLVALQLEVRGTGAVEISLEGKQQPEKVMCWFCAFFAFHSAACMFH